MEFAAALMAQHFLDALLGNSAWYREGIKAKYTRRCTYNHCR